MRRRFGFGSRRTIRSVAYTAEVVVRPGEPGAPSDHVAALLPGGLSASERDCGYAHCGFTMVVSVMSKYGRLVSIKKNACLAQWILGPSASPLSVSVSLDGPHGGTRGNCVAVGRRPGAWCA